MSNTEKIYPTLQKKYDLPSYEELDMYFDLGNIEHAASFLREIRKKIESKLEEVCGIFYIIFQPDTNIRDLHECHVFTDKEKARLFTLYREIMVLRREASLLSLQSEEKREAVFIKNLYNEWKRMHPEIIAILTRMRDSWKKNTNVKKELGYLG